MRADFSMSEPAEVQRDMDYAHLALSWLNDNSGLVIVAAVVLYGVITCSLLREIKNQATATRAIFEATHRPYVNIKVGQTDSSGPEHMRVIVVFDNQGSVPANITTWETKGTLMDEDNWELDVPLQVPIQSPVGKSIPPLQREIIHLNFIFEGLPNPDLPFRLHGTIGYRGAASSSYATSVDAEHVGTGWTRQGCTMT